MKAVYTTSALYGLVVNHPDVIKLKRSELARQTGVPVWKIDKALAPGTSNDSSRNSYRLELLRALGVNIKSCWIIENEKEDS